MTTVRRPNSEPMTSWPLWPGAVDTGKPSISPYGMIDRFLHRVGKLAETRPQDERDLAGRADALVDRGIGASEQL